MRREEPVTAPTHGNVQNLNLKSTPNEIIANVNALGKGAKTDQWMEKIVDRCTFIAGCTVHSGGELSVFTASVV